MGVIIGTPYKVTASPVEVINLNLFYANDRPKWLYYDSTTDKVWVAGHNIVDGKGFVLRINPNTPVVEARYPATGTFSAELMKEIAHKPADSLLWVTSDDILFTFNTGTNTWTAKGGNDFSFAVNKQITGRIISSSYNSNTDVVYLTSDANGSADHFIYSVGSDFFTTKTGPVGSARDLVRYFPDVNRLWVSYALDDVIREHNPSTFATINTYAGFNAPTEMYKYGDDLWIINGGDETIKRFNLTSTTVTATISLAPYTIDNEVSTAPYTVGIISEGAYIYVRTDTHLVKIDPGTDTVVGAVDLVPYVTSGKSMVASSPGYLWVTNIGTVGYIARVSTSAF